MRDQLVPQRKAADMSVQTQAAQLRRGVPILCRQNHHKAMAELKSQLGDPRPSGLDLSLAKPDSPFAYDGYTTRRGHRWLYRLSTSPDDYVWETRSQNIMRNPPEVRRLVGSVEYSQSPRGRSASRVGGLKGACGKHQISNGLPCTCGQHVEVVPS